MSDAIQLIKRPFDAPDPNVLQREASDPSSSVWVSASAGSGKTTVLVNRVLRLLLQGTAPQKILCLTFTRAAAAQMAMRVTARLSRWAVCSNEELRGDLDQLQDFSPEPDQLDGARRLFAETLSCPGGMRIRTIHSFCQEILRRFPLEAGVAPHFAVIEEADAQALKAEAEADVLQAAIAEPESAIGKALQRLVEDLGEHNLHKALDALLGEGVRFCASLAGAGSVEKLGAQIRQFFTLEPSDSEAGIARAAVDNHILPHADLLQAAKDLLAGGATCLERGESMIRWLELPAEERAVRFDDWCDCFFTASGEILNMLADKKALAKNPDLDVILRREATRLQLVAERLAAARNAETTIALLTFGNELMRRITARKQAAALLDYDDLVIRTDALLKRPGIAPWVLYKLDGGLDHILVDEAQDTSRTQWNIIAALAEEFFAGRGARSDENRTMFAVGDEKQSIFSFQHADPAAFTERREFFRQRIVDAEKSWHIVPMHGSWRSAPAILNAVNAVLADPRARRGVSTEPIDHYPAEKGKIGRVEVWPLVPAPEKEKPESAWMPPDAYEKERDPQAELAELIAGRIRGWLNKGEKLADGKPIAPGDIMILLRRRGRFADLMVRALKVADVPVTGIDRMHLIQQLPVMDLLALLQFALLPEDDLTLATILRGPLLGFSEEQLMELAIGRKETLWQSLIDKSGKNKVFVTAQKYLRALLNKADFVSPYALLECLLDEPCPANEISGRRAIWARLGTDALDPLGELLNAAQDYGRRHAPSLQGFLHWLAATEAEIKRELDQGGGEVRIMTVHAAKGLEAPIVFLPDTASAPRVNEMPKLLWSAAGVPLYFARAPRAGPARTLWDEAREKQMEEYRRLFYVALTRAAARLYIGGWEQSRKSGNDNECWYALAREALEPLHEPITVSAETPQPDIAFMDHGIAAEEKPAPKKTSAKPAKLPAWARQIAELEPMALRPIAPSRMMEETEPPAASPDKFFARGRIIHRLLQSLPDVEDTRRDAIAARFLANPQHRLPKTEQAEIAREVLDLLRRADYAPLFAPGSSAEVSLAGFIGAHRFSGQIDRLSVRADSVWIVDYKSNRPPPLRVVDVSPAYLKQLAAYRALLRQIYPKKSVKCFLLWTYKPDLMPIPDRLLTSP